jgi:hypothetical protein
MNEKCESDLDICSNWGDDQSGVAVKCNRKKNHEGLHRAEVTESIEIYSKKGSRKKLFEFRQIDIQWEGK